jgi:hypothetical protein
MGRGRRSLSFPGSGFYYAIAAGERGTQVGVPPRLDDVLRVDAAADGILCDGDVRFCERGVGDISGLTGESVSGEGELSDWALRQGWIIRRLSKRRLVQRVISPDVIGRSTKLLSKRSRAVVFCKAIKLRLACVMTDTCPQNTEV